jgi:hypothetical protein
MATILFYASLSIYRMDKQTSTKAVFILFATINSIYTSFWDIYYDWSLGDPHAKHRFLRKELAYKKAWWYYLAMCIDPILRFNWVPYAILPLQLQHSAVTSFCVSLSEIFRRGMWSIFRVENEHCTNVGRFRASRDVPLPYYVPSSEEEEDHSSGVPRTSQPPDEERPRTPTAATSFPPATTSGAELERTQSAARKRRGPQDEFRPSPLQRAFTHVGDIFRDAHAEDFERKIKPELGRDPRDSSKVDDDDTDDESDGEEEQVDASVMGNEENEIVKSEDSDGEVEVEDDEEESALSRIREDLAIGLTGARGDRVHEE